MSITEKFCVWLGLLYLMNTFFESLWYITGAR